ncbi:MAG: STAS domain-containing protein [Planctomycetes bacterium]|nr:STAS domain-containing protein [Planctomycetota bacterium]
MAASLLADPLLELASDERGGAFVVDLTAVRSLNAAFLTLLTTLRRTLARRSRRLSLCGVGSSNADLLRGSGLDEAVDLYTTRAEALASIDREA